MADESLDQPLETFIQNCINDVMSGTLTLNEAYVAMQQYSPLRAILADQKEITRDSLFQILNDQKRLIGEGVKYAEPLDKPMSPAEITARAQAFAKAQEQIPEAARRRFEQERKIYARRVANAWVTELRNRRLYDVTPQEEQVITRAIEGLSSTTSATEAKTLVTSQLQTIAQANPNLARGQEILGYIAQTMELVDPAQTQQQMTQAVIDNPNLTKPDILVGLMAQGVEVSRAASLARVAEALSLDINPAIDPTRPSIFFQAVASKGVQRLLAPAADALLTVLPQKTRETVIESILAKSWERVTKNIDQKLGGAVVSTSLFQEALAQGNKAFAAKPGLPAVAGVTGFVSDAFNTVFGPGIDQAMIQKYLETGRRVSVTPGVSFSTTGAATGVSSLIGDAFVAAPGPGVDQVMIQKHPEAGRRVSVTPGVSFAADMTFLQFYAAFINEYNPSHFSPVFKGGKWMLGFAGKKLAGAVARGIAVKLSGTAIGAFIGSIFPGAGTIVGAAIGFLGDKVLGGIWRGAKALFGGGFITRLFSGEPGRWQDDFPLVFAGGAVLLVVLLFIAPLPTNSQFIGGAAINSSLANLETGGAGGGFPICDPRTDPNCAVSFCDPTKQDCRWPTQNGCVTQGPNNGAGTHARLNAVDIGFRGATRVPVFATHNGTVVALQSGFGINEFRQNSYGNYVEVQGKNAGGKTFHTLYGHLAIALVSRGQTVTAGQQIGVSDNNGTSYGEHLHYEYRGGGDISEILPRPVPRCVYGSCPSICW